MEYLYPEAVSIMKLESQQQLNFEMHFFSEGPSTTKNVFKLLFGGLAEMDWSKDYWEIEGKSSSGNFTTTNNAKMGFNV